MPQETALSDLALDQQSFEKKQGRKWGRWLAAAIALLAIAGGGYFAYTQLSGTTNQESRRRTRIVPVRRGNLDVTVTANGTIQPDKSINASPKTSGKLKSLLVREGELVKAGQVLAYMDDSNLQGQLTQAQGQLEAAQANLQKLEAGNRPQDIAQAEANLKSAEAELKQADLTYNQNRDLFGSGAIATRDFENSRSARDVAIAKVMQAKQALSLSRVGSRVEDIAQAKAQVTSARGVLKTIQTQIDDTVIRAPFAGIVARKYADPGAFVTPTTSGSSVSSATASSILALSSNNQVVAAVAEADVAKIKLGQAVTIAADAYPYKKFQGKVISISPQSIVQQNVTSFEVKAKLVDDTQQELRAGMNINAEFQVGKLKDVLLVPTVAISRLREGTGVFVTKEGATPVFTPIVTGITVNNLTEVKSGLKGDEKILITYPEGMRQRSNVQQNFPGFQQPRQR